MATSRDSGHQTLLERDAAHLIHPLHNKKLHATGHVWVRGEGVRIYDSEGRDYIDGLSGLWNVTSGHGRRELVEAASTQMGELAYCSGYSGSTNPAAIELGERLASVAYPSINRFFLTSGGGESSDSNFKTARYYWRALGRPEKTKVISREWAYHGVTMAAMSATGMSGYWPMFEPRVPGFLHIPSPYPYRYVPDPDSAGLSQGVAAANELEKAILREGPETVAMFIAEPVQGAGGVIVPQDDYFPRIREICDEYDVLLASDEVITGFGRTGRMFGLEHWGVEPDLMQFAKGITSGYFPLGGIGMSDEVASVVDSGDPVWMHAYTYSGHPVGCRVALANLDIIEKEAFAQQAVEKGEFARKLLEQALGGHPNVGDVRGKGLMLAVEFVEERDSKAEFSKDAAIGAKLNEAIQRRGLFSRFRGDVFVFAPPIPISNDDIERSVEALAGAVGEVLG